MEKNQLTVMFPAKIISVEPGEFDGTKYYTLNLVVGGTMLTMTGKGDVDFTGVESSDVVLEAEIRGKAKGNVIRPDLRVVAVHKQAVKP